MPHRLEFRWLAVVALASCVLSVPPAAQDSRERSATAGHVFGRIVDHETGAPISGATMRVIVTRFDETVVLARGQSDVEGGFDVSCGPSIDAPLIVIDARDRAPVVIEARAMPQGEGLLLPTVRARRGATLEVPLTSASHGTGLQVRLLPRAADSNVVDLEGESIMTAPFREGRARLTNVPPGEWLVLVSDVFVSCTPRVFAWRMGHDDVVLPPLVLDAGGFHSVAVVAGSDDPIRIRALHQSGAWDPRGGAEFAFHWRPIATRTAPGRFKIDLPRLGSGVLRLDVSGTDRQVRFDTVVGEPSVEVAMVATQSVSGRILDADSGSPIAVAAVHAGSIRARTDERGAFSLRGLTGEAHDLDVFAPGYSTLEGARIVLTPGGNAAPRELRMKRTAVVSGRVIDDGLRPISGCLVGRLDVRADDDDREGILVHARTDQDGVFEMRCVPRGDSVLVALPTDGLTGVPLAIPLTSGEVNRVTLQVAPAGHADGRIVLSNGRPAGGVDVFLHESIGDVARTYSVAPRARLDRPRVLHAVTGEDGRYRLPSIPPGEHLVVVRSRNRVRFDAGVITVAAGRNTFGFDWTIHATATPEIDVPLGATYRLTPRVPGFEEIWVSGGEAGGRMALAAWPAGAFNIEPLFPYGSPAATREFVRAFWGDADAEGHVVQGWAFEPAELHFPRVETKWGRVAGTVTVGGEVLGERRAVVTAYPISGVSGLTPRRVVTHAGSGDFQFWLPRGQWFFIAESPSLGRGTLGPRAVATDLENEERTDLHVILKPRVAWLGRLAVSLDEPESDGGIWAHVAWRGERRLGQRWDDLGSITALEPDGSFRAAVPHGDRSDLDVRAPFRRLDSSAETAVLRSTRLDDLKFGSGVMSAVPLGPVPRDFGLRPSRLPDWWRRVGRPGGYAVDEVVGVLRDNRPWLFRRRQLVMAGQGNIADSVMTQAPDWSVDARLECDGRPLAFAACELLAVRDGRYDFGRDSIMGSTDRDGYFGIRGLTAGDYVWRTERLGRDRRLYRWSMPFESGNVEVGTITGRIEWVTGSLVVNVRRPQGEEPVAGARVRVVRRDVRGRLAVTVLSRDVAEIVSGYTDAEGVAKFTDLPLGTFDLKIEHPLFGATLAADVEVLDREREVESTVRMAVRGAIRVHVTAEGGRDVADAEVMVFDLATGAEVLEDRSFRSDTEGRVTIWGLAPASYRLEVVAADELAVQHGPVEVYPGGTAAADVACGARAATLDLVVLDARGRPLPNAAVRTRADTSRPLARHGVFDSPADERPTRTCASGTISLTGLQEGPYDVLVEAAGHQPREIQGVLVAGKATVVEVRLEKTPQR